MTDTERTSFKGAGPQSSDSSALARTIATLRRHPDLGKWYRQSSRNTAEEQVLREWQQDPGVEAALWYIKARRHGRALDRLLERAETFIEDETERCAGAWAWVTSQAGWSELKPVVRELFDVVHCLAAERGTAGGPNVRLSCRLAVDLIWQRFGHKYGLKTICWAGHQLEKLGALTRTVKSRRVATVYHLLPGKLRAVLILLSRKQAPSPQVRACFQGGGQGNPQKPPRFSDEDRRVFNDTVTLLKNWGWEFQWRPLWVRERPWPRPKLFEGAGPMPWEQAA